MAESLNFSIGADTKGFQDGIGGLLGTLAGLVAAFVSAQAIIEAFGQAIDMGGRLNDLSTRTGETAGNLAILERAFDNASVGADKLGPAIAKMQVDITKLSTDSEAASNAFTQLGLTFSDLEGKSPTEQLALIGQRLAALSDDGTRAATAVALFGRSGAELLPVLVNFASETAQAREQLGALPDLLNKTAATVDSLGDNLSAIKNKGTELAYGFLSEVVPAIEAFTSKLAGVDAASIGVGLADALVGAFVSPMKAAELLGQSLLLGVKVMGNELVYQINYWSQLMLNTFSSLGVSVIPMLGQNMLGAFEMAAASFGIVLVDTIAGAMEGLRGVAGFFGFETELDAAIAKVLGVHETLDVVLATGAGRIESSATAFQEAFANAQANSTVIREDIFGAGETSAQIAADFAGLTEDVQDMLSAFDSVAAAESRTTTGSDTTLLDTITAIDSVSKATVVFGDSAASVAKRLAEETKNLNAAISALAKMDPNQAIGQSQSAREAEETQSIIDQLKAKNPNDPRISALEALRDRQRDRALGLDPTASDRDTARDWALDHMNDPWNKDKSFDDLYEEALQNIEDQKRKDRGLPPEKEEDKKKDEDTTKDEEEKKPSTILSVLQSFLKTLQKIEPRIPVANLQ